MAENNINVENIMAEIRANIKESGADKIPLSFNENVNGAQPSNLDEAIQYLSYNYEVQAYHMLEGNAIKRFTKKCIRKLGSFFVLPIVAQQNKLNYNYYMVAEAVKNQKHEISDLEEAIKTLEAKVSELEGAKK